MDFVRLILLLVASGLLVSAARNSGFFSALAMGACCSGCMGFLILVCPAVGLRLPNAIGLKTVVQAVLMLVCCWLYFA